MAPRQQSEQVRSQLHTSRGVQLPQHRGWASLCLVAALAVARPTVWAAPGGAQPGLVWVFFNDVAMNRPADMGTDSQINLNTGTTINDYARVWLGRISAPRAGEVTFSAEVDNGFRLWLGEKLVIDGWSGAVREGTYEFGNEGESVPLRLAFFQLGGAAHMRLCWQWEGHDRELVLASAFSHTEEDLARVRAMRDGKLKKEAILRLETKAEIYAPGTAARPAGAIRLGPGPQLFIDDFLIESSEGLARVVNRPVRDSAIPNPLVTGKEDHCFQPYLTVLRDPQTRRFRLWYGCYGEDMNPGVSHLGYLESDDGIHWERPHRVLDDPAPIQFGVSILDEGLDCLDPARRFKYGWWHGGGLRVAASPDGLSWRPLSDAVVLYHNHDINSLCFDPLRKHYVATVSVYETGPTWSRRRRVTMQSFSDDLVDWSTPHYVLTPSDDGGDEGETQFYAMEGYLARGDLMVGMVKVLRDDLKADDPPDPPEQYGVGYTTLAWTRDGETWVRDREPFFDRDPKRGTWDHAHAWIDEQVPVGDEVYLYYGGYARGHKVNRFEERQLGLVRMQRDRYVAREAGDGTDELLTRPVVLAGDRLTLNVDSAHGEARVEVRDDAGKALPGFGASDCTPIALDGLDVPVEWSRPLSALTGRTVRLKFLLRRARLFGFGVVEDGE